MNCDEVHKLERTRRKALWALASLHPGDPNASELLAILDELDDQERRGRPLTAEPLELNEVRDSVSVRHQHYGIAIIFEYDIPQPWRERFLQASVGSTRVPDGPYATDWNKFLSGWEAEMRHLEAHRATWHELKLD